MSDEAYIEGITLQRNKAWMLISTIARSTDLTREEIILACKNFFKEDNAD